MFVYFFQITINPSIQSHQTSTLTEQPSQSCFDCVKNGITNRGTWSGGKEDRAYIIFCKQMLILENFLYHILLKYMKQAKFYSFSLIFQFIECLKSYLLLIICLNLPPASGNFRKNRESKRRSAGFAVHGK